MAKDKNISLLKQIHQNAQMDAHAVEALLSKTVDPGLKTRLFSLLEKYQLIANDASVQLLHRGASPASAAYTQDFTGVHAGYIACESTPHLASMLMQSSISEAGGTVRSICEHSAADQAVRQLALRLVNLEKASRLH